MRENGDWEKAIEFHGHICVGLALGYRAALAGLRELGSHRSPDEELVAIAETDNCAVDAIQVLTGCTFGKGNLIFRDYGKSAYTFGRRDKNRAVRVVVKGLTGVLGPEFGDLRSKVLEGSATAEDKTRLAALQKDAPEQILRAQEEDLLDVEQVELQLPERARIYRSVTCSSCGEQVMEPRARLRDGQPVCIPCSEHYQQHR
jgi:formylmethanofuran dehydrogenase subunit E